MKNLIEVLKPTVKSSKKSRAVKRMDVDQIYEYIASGNEVPKITRDGLLKVCTEILWGSETHLGISQIQNAVSELLKVNLIKVGVHPKDAEMFIEELPDGWEGTTEASSVLHCIWTDFIVQVQSMDEAA